MNLDDLETEVLCAVRRELTPAGETAARVRAAVLERIALTAAGRTAAVGTNAGSAGMATASKVGLAVLIGGVGLAGGWAVLDGLDSAASSPTAQRAAAPTPSMTSSARPSAIVDEAVEPAEPSPDASAQPPASAPPLARSRTPAGSARQSEQRLAEEVRLLEEADRALRARNPAAAAEVLAELERKVPGGKLDEERTAARLLTECLQRPGDETRSAARAFLAQHSFTVYSGRIRQVCQIRTRRDEGSE